MVHKMYKVLNRINFPADLKALSFRERVELCSDIRSFLIESVSKTGGHLASNLGVVEITVALHNIFNTPKDKIVFDVGHQCYTHKILTGRKDQFSTLRQENGLSGFPKTTESEYDSFNTGHSSTSISAALGLARARDLKNENHKVIALIGDGAMTGGLAYEALCDAGNSNTDLIVILNDNEMSITKNVGGLSEHLSKLRTQPSYVKAKSTIEKLTLKLPCGRNILSLMRKVKNSFKSALMHKNIFEQLGFTYLGAIDGNDLKKVEQMLVRAKNTKGPVIVHMCTVKGKGYEPAEQKPQNFHGIAKFDIETGTVIRDKLHADYSAIFGKQLLHLARYNNKIAVISPAMILGSGLRSFSKIYPSRMFDVGIAEGHAVTFAAGLASDGYTPVVCVYSSFLQRAYDQIIHDVAMQNLHVVFAIDRAGIVGSDGETHQGVFDMAFLNHIPNMSILVPSSFEELSFMLDYSINTHSGPIAIRYPRGNMQCLESHTPFQFGKADVIYEGSDITIVSLGPVLKYACEAKQILDKLNISAEVINIRTLKPLDAETVISSLKKTKRVIVTEDGESFGGLSSAIEELIVSHSLAVKYEKRGFDKFISQASPQSIYERNGITAEKLAEQCEKMCKGE